MKNNIFRQTRRFINRNNLINLGVSPASVVHSISHQWTNGFGPSVETLLERNFFHVASYTTMNAGDTLLPTVLRDLFNLHIGGIRWRAKHVYDYVGERDLLRFNKGQALVLGGGGLFLGDTNRNDVSGWQWPISKEYILRLKPKAIVFAVGYNKFRGQDDFGVSFRETIAALAEKSIFFGLRNYGSINSIKEYLPQELHNKVIFQPCMTTVLREIYPEKFREPVPQNEKVIALNCAFDRSNLRFGGRENEILRDIARVMKELSKRERICYFSHTREDDAALAALAAEKVPFTHVRLHDMPSSYVLECYKKAKLTIGMRGHAQMIPFGCGSAILSLISHNKMRWFLEDINCSDLGVEVGSSALYDELLNQCEQILGNMDAVTRRLDAAREKLWEITSKNMSDIKRALLLSSPQVG